MKIKEVTFTVTKTSTFEVTLSESLGYDMPETPTELVDMVIQIKNNPSQELAWNSDNCIDDSMVIDGYEIIEDK